MKKTLFQFVILMFLGISVFSQEQIHFRFSNPQILSGEPNVLQFDIEIMADNPGNFHRDFQIYIDYNTEAFGENVILNNVANISPLILMTDHYSLVNNVDNTNSKFAIVTDANAEMEQAGSLEFFNELPTEYTGFVRVEMNIVNTDISAGISFDQDLMNGGQFLQSPTSTDPVACANPNMYGNDLLDFSLFGLDLNLYQGWMGISSYMIPFDENIETMMNSIEEELVLLQNLEGVYYPEHGVNTLGNWDRNSGYVMKVSGDTQLKIFGTFEDGGTINLVSGWNLIPILSTCSVSIEELFSDILSEVIVIKEVAGFNVYWAEQGVYSLSNLAPGKSYYVKVTSAQSITFPSCD